MEPQKSKITRYLITGLITLLPLFITIAILRMLFNLISGVFVPITTPVLQLFFAPSESKVLGRLISFFLTLFVVWLIGALTTNIAGRRLLIKLESWLVKLPLLNDIYLSVRKLVVYVFTKKKDFKSVVLVEYPRKGIYAIGFVTAAAFSEVQNKTKEDVINVFVPSTPNPTTGMLLVIPKSDVIELDMSVDDAIRLIVTGGIVTPSDKNIM